MNKKNWMKNLKELEMTTDIGVTNLGKYTLPKILALPVNVTDVLFMQSEKNVHGTNVAM